MNKKEPSLRGNPKTKALDSYAKFYTIQFVYAIPISFQYGTITTSIQTK